MISDAFYFSPKIYHALGLLLIQNHDTKTFQKSPNLVTLSTTENFVFLSFELLFSNRQGEASAAVTLKVSQYFYISFCTSFYLTVAVDTSSSSSSLCASRLFIRHLLNLGNPLIGTSKASSNVEILLIKFKCRDLYVETVIGKVILTTSVKRL